MPQTQPTQPRIAKRMPCAVHIGRQRYSGLVLNLSQGGLFVQTNAQATRGAPVELELSAPERSEAIPLRAKVVWKRRVPATLRSVAHGGMGVQIENADAAYYELLAGWMRARVQPLDLSVPGRAPATEASPDAAPPSYRVRVRAEGSPRTRTLTIEASSAEAARAVALRWAGDGWRVIETEAL